MKHLNGIILLFFLLLAIFPTARSQGGLWAHMGGSLGSGALGQYGTKGVAAAGNMPAARYQGAYWTDQQGNFWLFGGFLPFGYGNDLWKYEVATNQWTWMNGPQYTTDQNGEWGTKGVPSVNNYPSARTFGPNCWTDKNGDLWLYGGFGFDKNNAQGGLADLWKYHIATNEWTWVWGADTVNQAPVHGTINVPAATNSPGARVECKSGWVDDNNNLWLFGGQDGATAQITINVRNDMWMYNTTTGVWTWTKGLTTMNNGPVWGTKGVESATSNPAARLSFTKWKGKARACRLPNGKGRTIVFMYLPVAIMPVHAMICGVSIPLPITGPGFPVRQYKTMPAPIAGSASPIVPNIQCRGLKTKPWLPLLVRKCSGPSADSKQSPIPNRLMICGSII